MTSQPKHFFFTPENMGQVRRVMAKYPKGKQASALMPLLDLAQRQNGGWLPRAAIAVVAELVGVPLAQALEAASFYTLFNLEPVGKHVVRLCRTTPCWLCGGEDIAKACQERLGVSFDATTQDGLFTLKEVECLGACTRAPVMQIDDVLYENLTPEKTVEILDAIADGKTPKRENGNA